MPVVASTCTRCGTQSEDDGHGEGVPPGWSLSSSTRGVDRLCGACTRAHVRDIEAKLDEDWWA